MKKIILKSALLTIVGVGLMAGNALATIYTDTFDANATYMEDGGWTVDTSGSFVEVEDDNLSWTFDIINDGFDPITQDITSADIALSFTDDSMIDRFEIATLNIGLNVFTWEIDTGISSFSLTSLMTLSNTGTVDATLTAIGGDFYFNSATLTANDGAAPVPEPATMLLFGTGLAGLVGVRRKKNKKA